MNIVPPSAPISPYYTIDVSSFSVLLEWSYPCSNGGVGISNYTTTLKASHTLHTYVERGTTLPLSLLYNKMHTAQIAAMNCVGIGPPAYVNNIYAGVRERGVRRSAARCERVVGEILLFLRANEGRMKLEFS